MTYIVIAQNNVYCITGAQAAESYQAQGWNVLHTTTCRDEAEMISGWCNKISERIQIFKWRQGLK